MLFLSAYPFQFGFSKLCAIHQPSFRIFDDSEKSSREKRRGREIARELEKQRGERESHVAAFNVARALDITK